MEKDLGVQVVCFLKNGGTVPLGVSHNRGLVRRVVNFIIDHELDEARAAGEPTLQELARIQKKNLLAILEGGHAKP